MTHPHACPGPYWGKIVGKCEAGVRFFCMFCSQLFSLFILHLVPSSPSTRGDGKAIGTWVGQIKPQHLTFNSSPPCFSVLWNKNWKTHWKLTKTLKPVGQGASSPGAPTAPGSPFWPRFPFFPATPWDISSLTLFSLHNRPLSLAILGRPYRLACLESRLHQVGRRSLAHPGRKWFNTFKQLTYKENL